MKKSILLRSLPALSTSILTFSTILTATAAAAPPAASSLTTIQAVVTTSTSQITQRQTTLTKLGSTVSSFKYGSPSSQATLQKQITDSSTGLTQLLSKIKADKTLAQARTDYSSIFTGYRVYMLVAPKVDVVKVADDQQAKEASLLFVTSLLQPYVHASAQAASLQPKLTAAIGQIQQAQKTSQSAEATVLPLTPNDYNKDHQIMADYFTQLKSAKTQLTSAYATLNSVMKTLKQAQESSLNFTEWGVTMPLSGKLSGATYQDITSAYSFDYPTVQVVVSGQPAATTCKGGVVGWLQRVPDTVKVSASTPHAHIGSYNYESIGVQDCAVQTAQPTLAAQFDKAVPKMVAN